MDIAAMARAAGLLVVLDGVIGRQEYQSVSGSLEALRRFGDAYTDAKGDSDVALPDQTVTGKTLP